jgi:signal transduction histidine kinase
VEDAGPGVPTRERSAIFERFYRGAAAGRRGASTGTGLGLALVAEHVKAHGGRIEVADRPGGGARFVVCLPLTFVPQPAPQEHGQRASQATPSEPANADAGARAGVSGQA